MPGGASDDTYTWDVPPSEGGARRAALADLGGAQVQDDVPGPDQGKDVYAGLVNELQRQVAGANRVISAARVWVRFQNGNPFVQAAVAMGSQVSASSFTLTVVSPGVVQVTWASGVLPPMVGEPEVSLNSGPGMAWGIWIPVNPNGVEIHTTDPTGQPAAMNFLVSIL
jgi:hypothetical protein